MGKQNKTAEERIADLVSAERIKRGWSQIKLAKEAGVSSKTIWALETGRNSTRIGTLDTILKTLGLSITLGGTNNGKN